MNLGRIAVFLAVCVATLTFSLCASANDDLLIYCGSTMSHPVSELARNFERQNNIKIQLSLGASEHLYESLRKTRIGDIYFPGDPAYRTAHIEEGLLGEFKVVGYNQIAIFVKKGNPKAIKADLRELLRKDVTLGIGQPEIGSIGRETKELLDSLKLYPQVFKKAMQLEVDSRTLNRAIKNEHIDVALNWRATGFFPENKDSIEVIDLDPSIAKPHALQMTLLTASRSPVMARKFIQYVASPDGQAVFRKYGFLDNSVTY
jgi:molybdate transport system substrate-binding protein